MSRVLSAVVGAAATAVAGAKKPEKGSDLDPAEVLEMAFAQAVGSVAQQAELVYLKHQGGPAAEMIDQSITELVDVFAALWVNETAGLEELAKTPPAPLDAKHRAALTEFTKVAGLLSDAGTLTKADRLFRGLRKVHQIMKS